MKITALTSDTHYGHKNILAYCNRPFSSVEDMNRQLVERYNSRIGVSDVVLWGGDCFFCGKDQARQIMNSLNGTKILVRGNHDRSAGTMLSLGFSLVMDECVIDFGGQTVRVKHYPYNDQRYPDRCPIKNKHELLIHGHTHSPNKVNGKQIHIGVDAWDYFPAMYDEIEDLVKKLSNKRFNHG